MMKLLKESKERIKFLFIPVIFFTSLFYNYLVSPNEYTSQMIIAIKIDENKQDVDITSPLFNIPSQNNAEIYQIKEYLTSKKAFQDLNEQLNSSNIDVNMIKPPVFDFFKRVSYSTPRSIGHIAKIIVNDQSKTIEFRTSGYDKSIGYNINLAIIITLYNYYNLQNRLNTTISSTNSLCDILSVVNQTEPKNEFVPNDASFEVNTGTELLMNIANEQLENCNVKNSEGNRKDIDNIYPSKFLSEFDSDLRKNLLAKLYEANISKNFVADKLKIISEPNIPDKPDQKRPIIDSIVVTLIIAFLFFGINIALRLSREYT